MTDKKKPIRVGVVRLGWQYAVDLDDDDMIERAKEALLDDIRGCVLRDSGELSEALDAYPDPTAKESDINDWLYDEEEGTNGPEQPT